MLSRYEKETVIIFNDDEKIVHLSTSQDWMKVRLKKMAEEHPEEVKIISENQYTLLVEVPKKYIHIRPPRQLSEEQKNAATERLRKYRENK